MKDNFNRNKVIKIMIYSVLILNTLIPYSSFILLGLLISSILLLNQEKKLITKLKVEKLLILFLTVMTISSITSELWYISIFFTLFFILKICFYLVSSIYINEKDINNILKLLLVLGIVVSIIGLVQVSIGVKSMPDSWIDNNVYSISFRIYSTFRNPNILAAFLNLIIITGITIKIYKRENKCLMILSNCGILLGLVVLFLTYSRGGWVSLCIALAFASFFERKYFKYLLFIVFIFIGFDSFTEVNRLSINKVTSDSSLHYRIEIWKSTIKILKENFILGIGKGTSWYYIHNYSDSLKWYVFHAHNLYLQILIDVGIIGFLVFISLVLRIWVSIKDNIFIKTDKGIINTLSLVFYISLLANGLIDSVATYTQVSIFIWFLLGINCKHVEDTSKAEIIDNKYENKVFLQNNIR